MSISGRVVWQEGMFLRAQHFQQQERWTEHVVRQLHAALGPHLWGVRDLEIDRGQLDRGRFAVAAAAGIFPDGTPFAFPQADCDAPPPLECVENTRDLVVHLALPSPPPRGMQVADAEHAAGRLNPIEFSAPDTHSGSPETAMLVVGQLRPALLRQDQDRAGHACIPIARIVSVGPDRRIALDDQFIPSALSCRAAMPLARFANELAGMLGQLAEALAGRLGGVSSRAMPPGIEFPMLQAANRWLPLLRGWGDAPAIHPGRLHEALLQIAGEWAAFCRPDRRPALYPCYRQHDLATSFAPLFADLRRMIPGGVDPAAIEIKLKDLRYNVRRGDIVDRALLKNPLYLIVQAHAPGEDLRRSFVNKVKIGPIERMQDLVNSAVSGIKVRPMETAPVQLPYVDGAHYFELDRGSLLFPEMETSSAFGIHYSDERSDMRMRLQLWSVRP